MQQPLSVSHDYLTIQIDAQDLQQVVQGVRVVVHTTGRWGNTNASDNHVTQYLLLPSNRAVQLNMRHTHNDLNGHLAINSRDYRRSRSEILHFPNEPNEIQGRSREVICNFTVRDVVGLFDGDHGSKDFTFAGGGNGCRYRQLVYHIH